MPDVLNCFSISMPHGGTDWRAIFRNGSKVILKCRSFYFSTLGFCVVAQLFCLPSEFLSGPVAKILMCMNNFDHGSQLKVIELFSLPTVSFPWGTVHLHPDLPFPSAHNSAIQSLAQGLSDLKPLEVIMILELKLQDEKCGHREFVRK